MQQTFILRPDNWERIGNNLVSFLSRLDRSKPWEIAIKRHSTRRSDQQNRYLWGVCYATIAQATGQHADDWHEYFLGECFGWDEFEMFGRKKLKPKRRSSRLTKMEFCEYVEFIQRRAAENGIYIPDPEI